MCDIGYPGKAQIQFFLRSEECCDLVRLLCFDLDLYV